MQSVKYIGPGVRCHELGQDYKMYETIKHIFQICLELLLFLYFI